MALLDNNTFIAKLTELFNDKKGKGTVWLTHKRFTYDGEDAVMSNGTEEGGDGEYPCLIRATDGKKIQFSTRVEPGELEKFHAIYGSLLKSSMSSLRKRDKKREKQRAEVAAARKRKLAETIIVQGPKRGNGRRKHQRSVKAALRQEASRKKAAEKDPPKLT